MHLAIAFCLALAAAVVESRPSTAPADSSKLNVKESTNTAVEARGLGDIFHNPLNETPDESSDMTSSSTSSSSASTTTSTSESIPISPISSSPSSVDSFSASSSSASVASPSPSPLSFGSLLGGGPNHHAFEDPNGETYGNDKITTSRNLGTTGDKVGFSWVRVD